MSRRRLGTHVPAAKRCVYIEVTGCLFYDLSEENSVLSHTGSSSFEYK